MALWVPRDFAAARMRAVRLGQDIQGLRAHALPVLLSGKKNLTRTSPMPTGAKAGWVRPVYTVTSSCSLFVTGHRHPA